MEQDESQERGYWLFELSSYVMINHPEIYEGWYEQEGQGGDIDEYLEIFYPEQAAEILRKFQIVYNG